MRRKSVICGRRHGKSSGFSGRAMSVSGTLTDTRQNPPCRLYRDTWDNLIITLARIDAEGNPSVSWCTWPAFRGAATRKSHGRQSQRETRETELPVGLRESLCHGGRAGVTAQGPEHPPGLPTW